MKIFVNLMVSGIKTTIADHFEMLYRTPNSIVRKTAFRKNAVNVWIPFKRASEGVKYTNKTRDKVLRLVKLGKHTQNNTGNSMKKTMK